MAGLDDAPTVRPYLSAEQLAAVTPWTPDAIEKLIRRGVLRRGVHYFQPMGPRSKLIFKWEAIVALIEGHRTRRERTDMVEGPRPRRLKLVAKKRVLNVETATTDLQRLLG